jgi:hypothetical protein
MSVNYTNHTKANTAPELLNISAEGLVRRGELENCMEEANSVKRITRI